MEASYIYGLQYKQPMLPTQTRVYERTRTYRAALEAVKKVLARDYAPELVYVVRLEDGAVVSIHATITKEETSG